jgi:F-type H+-transporting ATPase subunit delta
VRQTILAKRYAKALFAVSREEGTSDAYRETLNVLGDFLGTYPEAMDALTNLLYPMELREKVMAQLIRALQADQYMMNFLNLVVQKRRADILPEIGAQFQALVDADQNVSRGTVIAASEISGELQAKCRSKPKKSAKLSRDRSRNMKARLI